MMQRRKRRHTSGFTLIETMIVMLLMAVIAAIGIPSLLNFVARAKVLGAATQATTMFRLARTMAVKRNVTVVVKLVGTTGFSEGSEGEVFGFTDVNDDGVWDEPAASASSFDADGNKLQGSFRLPLGVIFAGPGVAADGNTTAFPGFPTASGGKVGIIRFLPSGAVQQVGAVRIRDNRDNILEVRIDQATTGRVSLRKFEGDPNGADTLSLYYVQGGAQWNWR